jgi:hypothetical protein
MHLKWLNWIVGFTIQNSTKWKNHNWCSCNNHWKHQFRKMPINNIVAKISTINLRANSEMDFIKIILIDSRLQIKLKRSVIHYKYLFHGKFFKSTFPWTFAFAMTSHKYQGATILSKNDSWHKEFIYTHTNFM